MLFPAGTRAWRENVNLRTIDLNLLVIFDALIKENSVSAAAERVGLSPSAVSHALRRLRVTMNDELFMRTNRGIQPTERAIQLSGEVGQALQQIEDALEKQQVFDPTRSTRTFRIQVSDYVTGFLLPRLTEHLRSEAPSVRIIAEQFPLHTDPAKEPADLQVRLTYGKEQPNTLRTEHLISDHFIVAMRKGHPAHAQEMTAEHYAALNHLKVSLGAIGSSPIDDALAKRGLKRNIVVTVPSWSDISAIIERSDLVCVVPNGWQEPFNRHARYDFAPLPLKEVLFSIDQCWDAKRSRDAGQKWLRSQVSRIFQTY